MTDAAIGALIRVRAIMAVDDLLTLRKAICAHVDPSIEKLEALAGVDHAIRDLRKLAIAIVGETDQTKEATAIVDEKDQTQEATADRNSSDLHNTGEKLQMTHDEFRNKLEMLIEEGSAGGIYLRDIKEILRAHAEPVENNEIADPVMGPAAEAEQAGHQAQPEHETPPAEQAAS